MNIVTETGSEALAAWEARCQSHGLLMTAPRRAILTAMSTLDAPRDAVTLLQAAREHHAATSMGTVYRLLRELEQCGLAYAHAQPHARLRWQLADSHQTNAMLPHQSLGNLRVMRRQLQNFLRDLENIGLAEARPTQPVPPASAARIETNLPSTTATFDVLRTIAEHLGYRLA